jgi:hypothetical protein
MMQPRHLTLASSPFAPNIPCTLDSGTIFSSADRCTSTARFKFGGGIEAFKIFCKPVRTANRTCGKTHRTQLMVGVRCTLRRRTFPPARGFGVMMFLATEIIIRPIPALIAQGGRGVRKVGSAAIMFVTPRPIVGALFVWWR